MCGKSVLSFGRWGRSFVWASVTFCLLASVVLAPSPTVAQLAPRNGWVGADGHSPFVAVVERVKDAVVNISAEKVIDARRFHFDPLYEEWFGPRDAGPSRQKSLGSGFIYRSDGYIITNNHVITGADNITVRLSDKREFPAKVIGTDQATDIALLKIDADRELPSIDLADSDSLMVGDWVVAIGNPFPAQGLDHTVTVGVISALGRKSLNFGDDTPVYQDFIQTDASINPGNSGGPLMGLDGRVIGINSAIASPTGSNVGIGFAIPINFAKMVLPELMANGTVERGWLGVEPRDLTWDDVEAEGLKSADGAIINRVLANTPADRAQLKVGDIVLAVDGMKVEDAQTFMRAIWKAHAGSTVKLDLIRRGESKAVYVTLSDRNAQQASATLEDAPIEEGDTTLWLGVNVTTATPETAGEIGTEYHPGVIVTSVDPAGPAFDKGIREGMIISEIDHKPIRTRADFEEVAAQSEGSNHAVSLLVYDTKGRTGYIAVRPEPR